MGKRFASVWDAMPQAMRDVAKSTPEPLAGAGGTNAHESQRTSYTKRRKQIWEALHPEEKSIDATCATTPSVSSRGRVGEGRPEGFASATAEATGQSKATTNRAIARADAIGDEALTKVADPDNATTAIYGAEPIVTNNWTATTENATRAVCMEVVRLSNE